MELEMRRHRWEHRRPDWPAAAVAGFAAGAVLMVLELLWAALTSMGDPWRVAHLVAALALGPGILQAPVSVFDAGVLAVALLAHYLLGVLFGLALGFVIAGFHYETSPGTMLAIGALFGALLYLVNFHFMTLFFPWMSELRGWATLIAHLIFGIAAALLYWKLQRRRD